MQTIKIENAVLEVDFEGLLSPRQEEVTAYRLAGKNKGAIATILGTSADTVNKHQRLAYEKLDVNGADNPLALLTLKAFQNHWARVVAMAMILLCFMPTVRTTPRTPRPVAAARVVVRLREQAVV